MSLSSFSTVLPSFSGVHFNCSMPVQNEFGSAPLGHNDFFWRSPVADIDAISSEKIIKCLKDRSEPALTAPMKFIDGIFNYFFPPMESETTPKRSREALQQQVQENNTLPSNYVYTTTKVIDDCDSTRCFRKFIDYTYVNLGWGLFIGQHLPLPYVQETPLIPRCSLMLYHWDLRDQDPHLLLTLSLGDACVLYSQQQRCIKRHFSNLLSDDLIKNPLEILSTNHSSNSTRISLTLPSELTAANWTLTANSYRLEPQFQYLEVSPKMRQICYDFLQKVTGCESQIPKEQGGELFGSLAVFGTTLACVSTLLVVKCLNNKHSSDKVVDAERQEFTDYGSMQLTEFP